MTRTVSPSPELEPCPFCGGPVELETTIDKRKWWGVVCRNTMGRGGTCAIQQRPSASKEAAIERWNTRAVSPDALESAQLEIARLNDWLVETQMNAHKWMEAHDKLKAGEPYSFPKPADLPDALSEIARLTTALSWFDKHGEHLANDVSSGHSARGSAASEWMREDDADFRRDLREALAVARAALKDNQP